MVTILEPKVDVLEPRVDVPELKVDVPVEPVPKSQELDRRAGYSEWTYAMPFAGVKYFSFRPAPGPRRADPADWPPEREAAPKVLAVELIDERVILL